MALQILSEFPELLIATSKSPSLIKKEELIQKIELTEVWSGVSEKCGNYDAGMRMLIDITILEYSISAIIIGEIIFSSSLYALLSAHAAIEHIFIGYWECQ